MTETRRPPLAALMADLKERAIDELHARLAAQGFPELRPGHGCVFRFIQPQGSRLTYLAERSGFTKQAVGEVVADLEALGYVERVPDPDDGRAKIIELTPRGEQGMRAADRVFAEIEHEWEERLGTEAFEQLRLALERLSEAAGEPTPEPLRG